MADVTSSEGDNRLVPVATAESCRATAAKAADDNGDEDKAATKNSIYEILESMTNEFNKSVCLTNNIEKVDTAEKTATFSSLSKVANEKSKEERKCDVEEAASTQEELCVPEENHKSETDSLTDKPEPVKKDSGLTRIVLTFRAIDENTDHGKKTKISSCSNLTLVPDELVNCDQFGGVSVKIENSDENMEDTNAKGEETKEPQSDETKEAESAKEEESAKEKKPVEEEESTNEQKSAEKTESKITEETNQVEAAAEKPNADDVQSSRAQEKPETVAENNVESNVETALAESTEQQEPAPPVTRKRRAGRPRLRALRFIISPYFIFFAIFV